MLDVAEAIFIKLADLMIKKSLTIRQVFTRYSVPEIFSDRTILELLSPPGLLEGIKDVGLGELQDFEIACLMRVLAKPELDNAVILNEFVMIMENFGVNDTGEGEDSDDYIPDTEPSVSQSIADLKVEVPAPADSKALDGTSDRKEDEKQVNSDEEAKGEEAKKE